MTKRILKDSEHYKIKPRLKKNPNPDKWKKDVSPVDALNPDRIGDHLPSLEQTYREAEYLSTIADSASRARSGGTWQSDKSSVLPLVLPQGRKAFKDFHDKYTREKERKILPQIKPINPNEATARYDGPAFKTVSLPETFCALCCKRDVQPGTGMLNTSPLTETWDGFNLKVGDVLRYVFCYHCTKIIKAPGSRFQIMTSQGPIEKGLLDAIERSKKIDSNVEKFLRAAKMAQTPDVFPKDD